MKPTNFPGRKAEKAKTIVKNIAERAKRGVQGQLDRLDTLFGVGQGATKERARLQKQQRTEA